jgi:hypothetical protein
MTGWDWVRLGCMHGGYDLTLMHTVHAQMQYEAKTKPCKHANLLLPYPHVTHWRLDKGRSPLSHVAKSPKSGCSWARHRPQTRLHTATTTTHWIVERMKLATAMQRSCGDPRRGSRLWSQAADWQWVAVRRHRQLCDVALGPDAGGGVVLGLALAMSIWACSLDFF